MADSFERILGIQSPDFRDTKEFPIFVEQVFNKIKRLGANAKFATLSGKGAPFYKVANHFGAAIENLIAENRITIYHKYGAKHFRVGGLKIEKGKPLPKEVEAMNDWQGELTRRKVRRY